MREVTLLLGQRPQLGLELADAVLQLYDVVAANALALGGVIVLAYRAGALAGEAAGERRVASCLSLDRGACVSS